MTTSTLSQVCEAIAEMLRTEYGWSTLSTRIGAQWLANNEDAPPRIVFILPRPGEEQFEAPDFIGQRRGHRPRAFRTRVAPLEIHCAAATLDQTERLAHDLASASHKLLYGSYQLLGGGYLSENESGWSQFTEVYVLRMSIRQPILETPAGTGEDAALITQVQQRSEVLDPATGVAEVDVDYPS